MTIINPIKNDIHIEETQYKSALSENLMTKVGATINWINRNAGDILGEIKYAYLTEAQFASLKGYDHTASLDTRKWALMSGQDITGSDFAVLTGITTLPNLISDSSFLRQAGGMASLGAKQAHGTNDHSHYITQVVSENHPDAGDPVVNYFQFVQDLDSRMASATNHAPVNLNHSNNNQTINTMYGPANETRPNCFAVNIFIKINN